VFARILLSAALAFFSWCWAVPAAFAESRPRVLFIASYHSSFPTFFAQVQGLRSVFDPLGAAVDVEALDAKRFPGAADAERFREALAAKLSRLPPYDCVLLGDDHALHFYLRERLLFGAAFAVFFGVNDRAFASSLESDPGIGGVVEDVSAAETLEAMLALNPGLSRVFAVADDTPAGVADAAGFLALSTRFPSLSFSKLDLSRMALRELEARLSALDPRTDAVLLLSAAGDAEGVRYGFFESLERISGASAAPVYHLWEHGMGHGLVGGKLVSQEVQARSAAEIALRRLRGTSAEGLPIIGESPNRYIFDARVLDRFGLRRSSLPTGSVLIGDERGAVARYGLFVLGLALEGGIIFLLLLNIVRRRRAQALLAESLREKELLLREIHHRVKNNLAVVSALLRLQQDDISDPAAATALTVSRARIQSMAVLHEELYREGSFSCVPMDRYLDSIVFNVYELFSAVAGNVEVSVEADDFTLCIDDLMAVGLIVNEALVNSFKYAFAGKEGPGRVLVSARQRGNEIALEISDDGTGFPGAKLSGNGPSGLGMHLIRELAEQLKGNVVFSNEGGARVSLSFESRGRFRS